MFYPVWRSKAGQLAFAFLRRPFPTYFNSFLLQETKSLFNIVCPQSCFWLVSSSTKTGNCLLILLILTDVHLFYFSQCWAKSAAFVLVGTCFSTERWIGCKLVRKSSMVGLWTGSLFGERMKKSRKKSLLFAIFSPFPKREPVHRLGGTRIFRL